MPSYYDDSDEMDDSSSPTKSEGDESSSKSKAKEEDDNQVTALLPKSILMGKKFKPGEEVVLKIVHEYDDEIEVAYATEKKSKDDSGESDRGDEMDNSMKSLEEAMS